MREVITLTQLLTAFPFKFDPNDYEEVPFTEEEKEILHRKKLERIPSPPGNLPTDSEIAEAERMIEKKERKAQRQADRFAAKQQERKRAYLRSLKSKITKQKTSLQKLKERKVRSKRLTEFCNSHYLSYVMGFFVDARRSRRKRGLTAWRPN